MNELLKQFLLTISGVLNLSGFLIEPLDGNIYENTILSILFNSSTQPLICNVSDTCTLFTIVPCHYNTHNTFTGKCHLQELFYI